jgi:hypothetical protein
MPCGSPLTLSRGQFLVRFCVVRGKHVTGFWHEPLVAIHCGFDECHAGGVHSIEKQATGRQTRCGVALFRGGLIDRQRLV